MGGSLTTQGLRFTVLMMCWLLSAKIDHCNLGMLIRCQAILCLSVMISLHVQLIYLAAYMFSVIVLVNRTQFSINRIVHCIVYIQYLLFLSCRRYSVCCNKLYSILSYIHYPTIACAWLGPVQLSLRCAVVKNLHSLAFLRSSITL